MPAVHTNKVKKFNQEDAVSPVIATILMVAITVVLAGTLYVWAANLAESNTDGDLELYTFDSNDAAGSPSTATDDNLAITTMTQGESIGWASLAVSVSVDGAAAVQCALPGQINGACIVVESETNDGGVWAMGEDITIQENGVDLCNAAVCELSISITNVRAGNPLGTTTTVAEQGGALVALPRMATQVIGPDGGLVAIQGATISIPAGALAADTELTFEALTAADVNDQDVSGYDIPTTFLKLTPHGTTFSQPVTVTIAATSGMPTNPTIYTKADDNSEWEEFVDQITVSGNTISFQIYGFSYYFGADATPDDVPRISYWWGKVNQHVENGQWNTDPDGSSGANLDMVQYCQKWYPDTVSVLELPEREAIVFYNAGNSGNFPTIKPVFECVQPDNGTGGGGSGGGDPNACSVDSDCMSSGYCFNGVCVYNDQDMDGISDSQDNCPNNANGNQLDTDGDGVGDICDNCPNDANTDQTNSDSDVYGDACDAYPNANNNPNMPCVQILDPVCGIDGNTYDNSCFAMENNVQVDYNGQCGNCVPDCAGCECGDDGCGGICGTCPNGESCNSNQLCVGCQVDTDCSTGYCVAEECVDCITDSDCPAGTICDGNGECISQGYGVVTWGDQNGGGNSNSVSGIINSGVVNIIPGRTDGFAALKSDDSAAVWGIGYIPPTGQPQQYLNDLSSGVESVGIQDLSNSASGHFAILKTNGSVLTWGDGYNPIPHADIASGVSQIYSNSFAFAALKTDGSVVTWGYSGDGGDSSAVATELTSNVVEISSTFRAFAALKSDGSVVSWGDSGYGGDSSSVSADLASGVVKVYDGKQAFAALKTDGSVVTWGGNGGDSSAYANELSSGVSNIFSTNYAFSALKNDGSIISWGLGVSGFSSSVPYSQVSSQLSSGVTNVWGTSSSFAALKTDGSVVTWGNYKGGDSSSVSADLTSGVVDIVPSAGAFAALKSDGSVITWGDSDHGGDSSSVANLISNGVVSLYSTIDTIDNENSGSAFAALKSDGSVMTWGHPDYGGDSSLVVDSLSSGVHTIISNGGSFAALDSDGANVPADGTPCDDGDSSTTNDVYTNGVCQGTSSNSPPVVSGVYFDSTSSGVFTYTTHNCLFTVSDADGDTVTTTINWYADGTLIGTGSSITLNPGIISVGDNLRCQVTPNDGTVDGQSVITVTNANTVVQNSSPSISSVVIGYSTQQHTSGTFAGDVLTCTASGTDNDNDALTYTYTWYLNGATNITGQTLDTSLMSSGDIVHCSAVANDGTDNSASVDSASTTVYTIHNIDIQNMAYSPSTITITAGDIIIWTNLDSMAHSVTSDDGTTFDSGLISNSQTFTLTGLSIGTYGYHCTPHPSMTGTIIVQ